MAENGKEQKPDQPVVSEIVEPLGAVERRFELYRRRFGLIVAPTLFGYILLRSFPNLSPEAHRLAAIISAVVVLWVTEALPIPATALIGATLCVIMQVAPAKEVFAPFADPLMFLFIGSFIVARAIFFHGLDRRVAFAVLSIKWVGARPGRILFAFGAVTCFMSAWISNTAVTAMMFAIGLSILTFLFDNEREGGTVIRRRYATGMMLMTSFGASIGGLATPVGTPPNLIGLGFIRDALDVDFPFFKWALIGVPIVSCLFLILFGYLNFLCNAGVREIRGIAELLEREKNRLGKWTVAQYSTAFAFLTMVVLWVVPGIVSLVYGTNSELYRGMNSVIPEAIAAMVGALLLFILPGNNGNRVLSWDEAMKIDWGVVLLYGGGFALGVLSFKTGLAAQIGTSLTAFLPFQSNFGLVVTSTIVAALVSEATSNTASANMVVPVVIAIGREAGIDPLEPAVAATFGSSLGFMLPVSTPCNAIVYGSGYVPLGRMIRYGILLDIAGALCIVTFVHFLLPFVR